MTGQALPEPGDLLEFRRGRELLSACCVERTRDVVEIMVSGGKTRKFPVDKIVHRVPRFLPPGFSKERCTDALRAFEDQTVRALAEVDLETIWELLDDAGGEGLEIDEAMDLYLAETFMALRF